MFAYDIDSMCKLASRKAHPENTIIKVGNAAFGGGGFTSIAGPCAVESEEQLLCIARAVKSSGADLLRAGAFKPRTSPYSFQGLGAEGLKILSSVKRQLDIPIITELTSVTQLELFDDVDVIQIGARNMQNFELLRAVGKAGKPVMLKRSPGASCEELLLSAEYIMAEGNKEVILCERGVRSFSADTRYTPDAVAIPVLKTMTHLPVIADPSHSTGRSELVIPMALAYAAAGADGLMLEVHSDPEKALCDGAQAITPESFGALQKKLAALHEAIH